MLKLTYVSEIASLLRWVWNHLLVPFTASPEKALVCGSGNGEKSSRVIIYKAKQEEEEECAVCLCAVEEGEEIRELRCEHVFHNVCLDRWSAFGTPTCPLCRHSINEDGHPLLLFDLHSFVSGDHRDRWWLR